LLTNGIEVSQDFDPQVQAGLSGALAAIAETGTLVLPSGAGRGQFVSLTPEIHIAVLDSRSIYQDLSQVLNLPELREASAISLISGPSRTADIEMTLTIGVHGPSQVRVFCFKGE
jgi:L-lactate dehydrogenase complex protein LldG